MLERDVKISYDTETGCYKVVIKGKGIFYVNGSFNDAVKKASELSFN